MPRCVAPDQERVAATADQVAVAGAAEYRCFAYLNEMRVIQARCGPVENAYQPASCLGLNNRRIPSLLALAERGVFTQALRFLLGIHHDPRLGRCAPEHQLVDETRAGSFAQGFLIDLGADI